MRSYQIVVLFVACIAGRRGIKWTASSENVPSSMRKMYGLTSSCARARSHPGLCSSLIHSMVFIDSVSGRRRPRSDCANAQSDLGLRCPHMPEDTFSHGAAKINLYVVKPDTSENIFNARAQISLCIHGS